MTPPKKASGAKTRRHLHDLRAFQGVEAWVFDLDNTLYPAQTNLFKQIDQRISEYVSRHLGLEFSAARKKQKEFYREYGTTLRGLMLEHDVEPDAFLEYAHNIDYSSVEPNPELAKAIEALPGRKFIFTNGDRPHAERTAARLGITDQFEDIFDIVAADLLPKPNRQTYEAFLKQTGVAPARAAMFEDLSRNLEVPHRLAMRTVLIVPEGAQNVFREDWELEGDDAPHVDFVTDDLTKFLKAVGAAISCA